LKACRQLGFPKPAFKRIKRSNPGFPTQSYFGKLPPPNPSQVKEPLSNWETWEDQLK